MRRCNARAATTTLRPMAHPLTERLAPLLPAFQRDDLEILVGLAVLVAYADGNIDGPELEALRVSLETIFKSPLSELVVKTFVGSAVDDIKAAGADAYAGRIGDELKERGKGVEGLRVACAMAMVSSGLSDEERMRLEMLAQHAGVGAARLNELVREVGG